MKSILIKFFVLLYFTFSLGKDAVRKEFKSYPNVECHFGEKPFGDVCVKNCPTDYHTHPNYQDRCFKTIEKAKDQHEHTCKLEIPSMFFSWVSYDSKTGKIGAEWGENFGDNRLAGCGNWEVSQVIHKFSHKKGKLDVTNNHRQFVLFVENKELSTVIIAFRGTEMSLGDWIDNFETIKIDCPFKNLGKCGKIHFGFYQSYKVINEEFLYQAQLYAEKGYKIIFTGHSQGSCTSCLGAMDFADNYPKFKKSINLFMFASTRVGNSEFVRTVESNIPSIKRFTSQHNNAKFIKTKDIVTSLPPHGIGFDHILPEIIISCKREHFKNENSIRGVDFHYVPKETPKWVIPFEVGCHWQEVYMDGVIEYLR